MKWLGIGLLGALAIYGQALRFSYVYEDQNWLPTMRDSLSWHLPGRSLTQGSYQLEERMGFGSAVSRHGVNVGLLVGLGGSVYALGRRLGMSPQAAGWSSLVLWWHPLMTQTATYVSARSDLLMSLWGVLACVSALGRRSWRWPVTAMCVALAAMSKESGVLVVPLVAWTLVVMGRWTRTATIATAVSAGVIALGMGHLWFSVLHVDVSAWVEHASIQAVGLWRLVRLFLWPDGLSIDPDPWAVTEGWRLVALGGVCGLVVLMACAVRRYPWIALGVGWVLVCAAPRFVAVSAGEPFHEHQFTVGLVGLSLMTGVGMASILGRERQVCVLSS